MIDFNSFAYPNITQSEFGDARIINDKNNDFRLFVGDKDWMSDDIQTRSSLKEFYGACCRANGDVLLSGLGFGILPVCLATKDNVKSILVIEKYESVIELFKKNNPNYSQKIKIINDDINSYKTLDHFDYIHLDHYEYEPIDYQIKNMQDICKNIPNHSELYAWRIELLYLQKMLNSVLDNVVTTNKWKEFKKEINISTLSDLSNDEIRDYCCLFAFKVFYKDFIKGKSYEDDKSDSL